MRLDKLLSSLSYGSRSDLKKMVKDGLVTVNGAVAKDSSIHVNENTDLITVNGEEVFYKENITLILDKKEGYICSNEDEDYPSAIRLLPTKYQRLNLSFAGRLDQDTTGLVILTNNGKLIHEIITPKKNVYKKYLVTVDKPLKDINQLTRKMEINDYKGGTYIPSNPIVFRIDDNSFYLSIHEGKYHQVKEMVSYCGSEVIKLRRFSIGSLNIDVLNNDSFKELTDEEISLIFK